MRPWTAKIALACSMKSATTRTRRVWLRSTSRASGSVRAGVVVGAKTADEQEAQLYRWVASKPEWLNLFAAQRLVERVPAAAQYLPTTPEQMRIYDTYNAIRSRTGHV